MIKTGKTDPRLVQNNAMGASRSEGLADIKEDEVVETTSAAEENQEGVSDEGRGDSAKTIAKHSLSLPVTSPMGDGSSFHRGIVPRETEADWVLLNLYFGVPLFDDKVNKDVCTKIAKHELCRREK